VTPEVEAHVVAEAIDALTDVALFITVYVSLIATIYGIGEPQTKGEAMGRAVGLWTCAVCGVMLVLWLFAGLLIRLGIIVAAN
jgi:hypothetical protein